VSNIISPEMSPASLPQREGHPHATIMLEPAMVSRFAPPDTCQKSCRHRCKHTRICGQIP